LYKEVVVILGALLYLCIIGPVPNCAAWWGRQCALDWTRLSTSDWKVATLKVRQGWQM